jgi:hypothetical protein
MLYMALTKEITGIPTITPTPILSITASPGLLLSGSPTPILSGTPASTFQVTGVEVSVLPETATSCPTTFTATATINVNMPGTVKYKWELGDTGWSEETATSSCRITFSCKILHT